MANILDLVKEAEKQLPQYVSGMKNEWVHDKDLNMYSQPYKSMKLHERYDEAEKRKSQTIENLKNIILQENNGHDSIDSLMFMNDLQQFASPSTTAVSTTVPSGEDFQRKRTQNLANLVGSIGSPQGLSNEELLEMVMSTSPVGASIRGGKVAKSTLEQLLGLSKKHTSKSVHKKTAELLKTPGALDKEIESIKFRNDLSLAKMRRDYATAKHGVENPDKQGMVDPVSALLNYFSKN